MGYTVRWVRSTLVFTLQRSEPTQVVEIVLLEDLVVAAAAFDIAALPILALAPLALAAALALLGHAHSLSAPGTPGSPRPSPGGCWSCAGCKCVQLIDAVLLACSCCPSAKTARQCLPHTPHTSIQPSTAYVLAVRSLPPPSHGPSQLHGFSHLRQQ